MTSAEKILSGRGRVHCLPYAANLSREACLKQQALAKRCRKDFWAYPGEMLLPRQACLTCKTGQAIREGQSKTTPQSTAPRRTQSCRHHPDRPRHGDLLVCLPCYRAMSRRLNKARQGMIHATPKVRDIYRATIRDLERQIGLRSQR